nr:hypothetical protein [Tanacetum cinerariifolium]
MLKADTIAHSQQFFPPLLLHPSIAKAVDVKMKNTVHLRRVCGFPDEALSSLPLSFRSGYLVIESFLGNEEVVALRKRTDGLCFCFFTKNQQLPANERATSVVATAPFCKINARYSQLLDTGPVLDIIHQQDEDMKREKMRNRYPQLLCARLIRKIIRYGYGKNHKEKIKTGQNEHEIVKSIQKPELKTFMCLEVKPKSPLTLNKC